MALCNSLFTSNSLISPAPSIKQLPFKCICNKMVTSHMPLEGDEAFLIHQLISTCLHKITLWHGNELRTTKRMSPVQWSSARVCEPRVPGSNLRYTLTPFHYLISPPSGQRLPKLLLCSPQTGLTTFICVCGCSSD